MQKHLLLSVTSEDKPGVVEKLSSTIEACGGNWLESRLANLRGRFVGMIWVEIPESRDGELSAALGQLSGEGINVDAEDDQSIDTPPPQRLLAFYVVGPDRSGIIKEVSQALSASGINVESLETSLISAAYSGEPIFEARGEVSAPPEIDLADIEEKLITISDELGLTIDLESN